VLYQWLCVASITRSGCEGITAKAAAAVLPDSSTMDTSNLPIRQYAADILAAVENNDVVVVIGETGSGKTTQLSQVKV
jgi:HrpA-like RNA helicase